MNKYMGKLTIALGLRPAEDDTLNGGSGWDDGLPSTGSTKLSEGYGPQKYDLLGYSLGGAVAFSMLHKQARYIRRAILMAPGL